MLKYIKESGHVYWYAYGMWISKKIFQETIDTTAHNSIKKL